MKLHGTVLHVVSGPGVRGQLVRVSVWPDFSNIEFLDSDMSFKRGDRVAIKVTKA